MKNIETQVNKTLESIDNIGQAEASAYFETRLRARMEKRLLQTNDSWFAVKKPVWAIVCLITFLCINIYLLNNNKAINTVARYQQTQPATIENFANDYQLSTTSTSY